MMKTKSIAREFALASVGTLIALVTGISWIGEPLRLFPVLTLVALGMAAGASLTQAIMRWRNERGRKGDAPGDGERQA
jgi:hypothetical protein